MRTRLFRVLRFCLIAAISTLPPGATATTIQFQATDVTDAVPGEDLWSYTYSLSDASFVVDVGFSIFFEPDLYRELEDPPPLVNDDWDVLVLQPDPLLPDDGLYDALALVDDPRLGDSFTLEFVWLGTGGSAPGAQPFAVSEFDSEGNFVRTLESSITTPVPDPSTSVLVLIGLVGISAARLLERSS